MRALGLVVCVIGIAGAIKGDPMLLVVSLALGCIAGEMLGIEKGLNRLGESLQRKFGSGSKNRKRADDLPQAKSAVTAENTQAGSVSPTQDTRAASISPAQSHTSGEPSTQTEVPSSSRFAEGFITATLLFCVGAMTVVGSIESGLTGDRSVIMTKSILDCISAMIFASAFGFGVLFSAGVILLYQGGIEFFASHLQGVLTEALITQVSAVGSVMILALGLNMILDAKIRAANLLPGFLFAAGYYYLFM